MPVRIDKAWYFFTSPDNLSRITPESMGFKITSDIISDKIYPGMIITYKVYPFRVIPARWVTEITHVIENRLFVDEQRVGPYALWHHEHHFEEVEGGVKMTDIVSYKPPLGFIGRMVEPVIVRPQLGKIFNYRWRKLIEIFGTERTSQVE